MNFVSPEKWEPWVCLAVFRCNIVKWLNTPFLINAYYKFALPHTKTETDTDQQ